MTSKASQQLDPKHLSVHLDESGISEDVLDERGCYTVTKRSELERRGFSNRQIRPPGVMYPIHGVNKEIRFFLYRADDPRIRKGKPAKYEFPPGQKMAMDVPPRCSDDIGDPNVPLFVTEGIKKADSGASRGLCIVSIIGTWNWRGTNEAGGKTVLADWEYIALKDKHDRPRRVYIVFDSDIMQKIEVYRALKRLKALLEQRGADVRIIYLPNGENGAKVGLDDFFAQGNTLDTLLEHAQKELKLPPDEAIRTEHTLVVDAVHDIPAAPGLRVPSGYELGEGGVLAVNMDQESLEERRTVVAPAPMIIAGRTTDIHDGRESAELVYKRGKQWVRQTASRAMISNSREIVKLADFGAPVTSGSAAGVVEYLGHFDTANITQLPHGRTSAQMGWQGRLGAEGFLWGKRLLVANQPIPDIETNVGDLNPEDWPENAVMFRGADVGDEQLAGGFSSGGTLEEWQNIMDRVTQFKKVRLTIVAALAAPVLEVINGYNFILDLANPTSRGKTTVLRLAASCWGNPDERAPESVLGTWDATRVWIERASSVLNSMPLMLDDTKRARHPRIVAQTLYDVASGRGRGRGSVHGLGRSGSWSTVLICTGEQPATSFTEDGGTRARVLTLWGSPFEVVSETVGRLVSSVDLLARENYGHAGPRLVQHLLDNHELWPQYRNKHSQYKRLYAEKAASDPVLGRMADYFATLRLTAEIATDHTRILPWEDFDPIEPLWDTLASEASEADRAESALRLVLSWAVSNQHTFYGREREDGYSGDTVPPHRGYSGKWDKQDWEYIAFYPHRIKRLIEDHGFDVESTLRTWRDRGWLDTEDEKRRNTKRLRISGERAHVVCITRDAYDEVLN